MKSVSRILAVASVAFVLSTSVAWAAEGEEFDPVHHVADGYYLDFEPFGHIELPRIFVIREAGGGIGLDFFWSTTAALRSGAYVAAGGHHGPVAETPAEGFEVPEHAAEHGNPVEHTEEMVTGATHLETELAPVGGELIIDLSISRHLVFAVLAALIVLIIFVSLARKYQRGVGRDTAPRGTFQNMFETLVVFVRDDIAKPNLGPKYEKFLPYLLTAFFFILTANLLGLVPFGATATSNLMITATLAAFTFLLTQINASKDYWMHIFWPPGVPTAVKPIMVPVEIMGVFTKPIALAIRLFANMTAGHLVILSLIGLIFTFTNLFGDVAGWGVSPVSVAFALFIFLLELLVAFIQAYVFTLLSALFIGMAVEEHAHDHHEDLAHRGILEPAPVVGDHGQVTPHIMPGNVADNAPPAREQVTARH